MSVLITRTQYYIILDRYFCKLSNFKTIKEILGRGLELPFFFFDQLRYHKINFKVRELLKQIFFSSRNNFNLPSEFVTVTA